MVPSMGRRRTRGKHLPWRMYAHGNGFRFHPPGGKPIPLGSPFATAILRYAEVVAEYKGPRPKLRTMGDVFDRYEAEVIPTKAESTQVTNRYELGLLRKVFRNMTPTGIKPRHIYGYMDHRPHTRANREVALLSHVFTKAVRWGACDANPCRDVERNKEAPSDRYVDADEFWAVYDIAPPEGQVLMLLTASCGFRLSELLRLRWDQVKDDGIHIQRGKGGKRQVLVRNTTMSAALDQARAIRRRGGVTLATPYVFCRRDGKPYTKDGVESMWTRLMNRWAESGGEKFQIRDLRAKSGSDHETGAHLGHRSDRTLQRHYRRRPDVVEVVEVTREADNG